MFSLVEVLFKFTINFRIECARVYITKQPQGTKQQCIAALTKPWGEKWQQWMTEVELWGGNIIINLSATERDREEQLWKSSQIEVVN